MTQQQKFFFVLLFSFRGYFASSWLNISTPVSRIKILYCNCQDNQKKAFRFGSTKPMSVLDLLSLSSSIKHLLNSICFFTLSYPSIIHKKKMAILSQLTSTTLQATFCILLLALTFGCASSARILDEVSQVANASPETDESVVAPVVAPVTTSPSNQLPASATAHDSDVAPVADPSIPADTVAPPADLPAEPEPDSAPVVTPAAAVAPPDDITNTGTTPVTNAAPAATPVTTGAPSGAAAAATSGAAVASPLLEHPTFSFFMHDILGGSHPSGRVVTGIVATSDANNLPFSNPNNQIFPITGGVPLNTINNIINNNNYPFLVGLNGQQQSNTVLTSSSDGTSHTLALTALFHGEHDHEVDDTISFFGVHRTATPISHIAIIGGTGKYENAKGFATIETLPHVDQHTTDGLETITHCTVYITP